MLEELQETDFLNSLQGVPEPADLGQALELMPSVSRSGRGGHQPTRQQKEWARYFVLTGSAMKAAKLAGYASPNTSGAKNLCHPSVLDEVKRLSVINMQAHLPAVLNRLLTIALDPETDRKAAVAAINSFLDRAGLKPKSDGGPSVNVQVNVNGQEATAAIASVWEARNRRITPSLSDIDGTMPDTNDRDDDPPIDGTHDTGGGCNSQGPDAQSHVIPASQHANPDISPMDPD